MMLSDEDELVKLPWRSKADIDQAALDNWSLSDWVLTKEPCGLSCSEPMAKLVSGVACLANVRICRWFRTEPTFAAGSAACRGNPSTSRPYFLFHHLIEQGEYSGWKDTHGYGWSV
jgi:hypothetical protein